MAKHSLAETLLSLSVLVAILGGSWYLTHLFTRAMYNRCGQCRSLNAKRRSHCRNCGTPIPGKAPRS